MKISDCMKRNVVSIPETSTVRAAAVVFVQEHIGLLPIVNENHNLVGVIGLRDLLSLVLPDFVNFVVDVDFVHDFGAVETTRPSEAILNQSIKFLMKPPITVNENSGLLRAYALMLQHYLHDMPVLSEDGKLVGMASRVDIGTAIVSAWTEGGAS
ncbi:MAG TPA: CBS domain-containing protein [Anaerolineales bacterium]|nr:CBS domain-containing protein [Anaerolineales bacterium]